MTAVTGSRTGDGLIAGVDIVDTDTHVVEPPDLWTSRLSASKWGDDIPRVVPDERFGRDRWLIGGRKLTSVPNWAWAGWHEYPPSHPPRLEDADPAAYDSKARLAHMDASGIYACVMYPNLLAFVMWAFMTIPDEKLKEACVQAYNDFQSEFADVSPDRFVALTVLPFWDVEASIRELNRCHEMGHRGVLFIGKPHKLGLPKLVDDHWEPLLKEVESRGLSVNFHTAFQEMSEEEFRAQLGRSISRPDYVRTTALGMIGLAETLSDVLLTDLCVRYPSLKFVSVESGFGWMPYFVELLDWQWLNSGAGLANPHREMPSFYFRRQVLGTFWFEQGAVMKMISDYADNVMFETDFPHPTSLCPGPASMSDMPRVMAAKSLSGVSDDVIRKVLFENAAALYHVRGREAWPA
jgi:predicted TIM-barrel fold metal-dependent hydrolase